MKIKSFRTSPLFRRKSSSIHEEDRVIDILVPASESDAVSKHEKKKLRTRLLRWLKKCNAISSKKGFGLKENHITHIKDEKKSRRKRFLYFAKNSLVFGARYTLIVLPSSKIITVVAKIIVYSDNVYIIYDLGKSAFNRFFSDHDNNNDNKHETLIKKRLRFLLLLSIAQFLVSSKSTSAINIEDPKTTLIKKEIMQSRRSAEVERLVNYRGYSRWYAKLETNPLVLSTLITSAALMTTFIPPTLKNRMANFAFNTIVSTPGRIIKLTLFSIKCTTSPRPCVRYLKHEGERKIYQAYLAAENLFVAASQKFQDEEGFAQFIFEEHFKNQFNYALLQYVSDYLGSSK